jgi:hypothetical protein
MEDKCFILEGTWRGKGQVTDKIPYEEELVVNKLKPTLFSITQNTWNSDIGPLHKETGYIKLTGDNKVELILAHPFGIAEVSEGTIDGKKITFKTKSLSRASSATEPYAVSYTRVYSVNEEGTSISFDMYLATTEHNDERHHLNATLLKA